jgi:protein-S-isoprenylcysteine O-methyltransferase Ste14
MSHDSSSRFWFVAGLILFAASFFLRRWLIQTLGKYWSVYVEIREDHPLITDGPFRYCRHPNYLSILMEVFGYCFVFQAWWTLALTLVFYVPGLYFRISIEEREMIKHFGKSYERYIETTHALLPLGIRE